MDSRGPAGVKWISYAKALDRLIGVARIFKRLSIISDCNGGGYIVRLGPVCMGACASHTPSTILSGFHEKDRMPTPLQYHPTIQSLVGCMVHRKFMSVRLAGDGTDRDGGQPFKYAGNGIKTRRKKISLMVLDAAML